LAPTYFVDFFLIKNKPHTAKHKTLNVEKFLNTLLSSSLSSSFPSRFLQSFSDLFIVQLSKLTLQSLHFKSLNCSISQFPLSFSSREVRTLDRRPWPHHHLRTESPPHFDVLLFYRTSTAQSTSLYFLSLCRSTGTLELSYFVSSGSETPLLWNFLH
jgi:hypothetical protein